MRHLLPFQIATIYHPLIDLRAEEEIHPIIESACVMLLA